jgi:hypothetical protein
VIAKITEGSVKIGVVKDVLEAINEHENVVSIKTRGMTWRR